MISDQQPDYSVSTTCFELKYSKSYSPKTFRRMFSAPTMKWQYINGFVWFIFNFVISFTDGLFLCVTIRTWDVLWCFGGIKSVLYKPDLLFHIPLLGTNVMIIGWTLWYFYEFLTGRGASCSTRNCFNSSFGIVAFWSIIIFNTFPILSLKPVWLYIRAWIHHDQSHYNQQLCCERLTLWPLTDTILL